jgi:hypothetical protein
LSFFQCLFFCHSEAVTAQAADRCKREKLARLGAGEQGSYGSRNSIAVGWYTHSTTITCSYPCSHTVNIPCSCQSTAYLDSQGAKLGSHVHSSAQIAVLLLPLPLPHTHHPIPPSPRPCTPQAQPTGKKLSDPRKYSPEQLVGFLAALHSQRPDPRAPGKELVKPQKLLKRFLPWFTNKLRVGLEWIAL